MSTERAEAGAGTPLPAPGTPARSRPPAEWLILVALTGLALYLCWSILEPFLPVLLWAVVLVLVFYPAHNWWLAKLNRPSLAALITTLLVIVTIIAPLVGVISAVVAQLQGAASAAQGQVNAFITDPAQAERLQRLLDLAEEYVGLDQEKLREGLQQAATGASQLLVQGTMNVLGGALGFVVSTFFVMFTMYYLFKDGDRAVAIVRDMLPLDRARSERLIARTGDIIAASVLGVVVISVVQGTLGGLMFWFLGLPAPLVWGVVMIVFATIPMLGTFVVWVPFAIFLAVTGHPVKALILTGWGALVIGMVDNFLRPQLVGQRTQMHELIVFFSVLGGLKVFGVLGILMGPVVVAVGLSLLDALRQTDDVPPVLTATPDAPPASVTAHSAQPVPPGLADLPAAAPPATPGPTSQP